MCLHMQTGRDVVVLAANQVVVPLIEAGITGHFAVADSFCRFGGCVAVFIENSICSFSFMPET